MAWKDNAFGVSIDRTMNADYAKLKSEGASFVVIELGKSFDPNPVAKDQCDKAKAAGLPVLLKYVPDPAYVDYTYDGLPNEIVAYLKRWIAGLTFHALVISIEQNKTAPAYVVAVGDGAISHTSEVVVRTMTKYFNDMATLNGTKPISVLVRTNDGFVKNNCPSVSNWTDSFGFVLADWRYRTRDANGTWNVLNYFKTGVTNTVSDIRALFPTVANSTLEIKNPLVPGNAPQLKVWEYSGGLYSLPYIKGWDNSTKKVEVSLFNGDTTALNTYLNYNPVVVPPVDDDPEDPGEDDTPAVEVDLTEVNAKLDKVLVNQVLILQGINDLKSVFSKFGSTTVSGFRTFMNNMFGGK